jgi:transposase
MHPTAPCPEQNLPHVQDHQTTLYASLELSRSTWLVTSLACGSRKMSKHSVAAGDGAALLALLVRLRGRVEQSAEGPVEVVVVQEAGRDGFWVHRLLEAGGI